MWRTHSCVPGSHLCERVSKGIAAAPIFYKRRWFGGLAYFFFSSGNVPCVAACLTRDWNSVKAFWIWGSTS